MTSSPGLSWSREVLPSGVRVILAPLPGRTSASVSLLLGVGSRWERPRWAGISHFLEHIVFKGTRRYPHSREVSESIEGVGGVLNASTDKELTVFWAKVPKDRLDLAVDVLTDLTTAPTIDPAEVDRERQVLVEELNMYLDQPSELVQMDFDRMLWESHPLARDPAGTRASLGRIGAAELRGYRETFYRPERLVVVLSGALRPAPALAALRRRLEPALAAGDGLAATSSGDGGEPAPLADLPEVNLRRRRGEQIHLMAGVRCSSYLAPDRWVLDTLNTVLGEGMSSRLFLELRERRALAYDVHSFTSRHHDSGCLAIYLATRPQQAVTALAGALAELRRLAEEPLPTADLERTKDQIEGRLLLQLESAGGLAEFLGQQELLLGEILSPGEVIANIRSVDADQVQAMAGALLGGGGWRVAGVGPAVSQDELLEVLAAGS